MASNSFATDSQIFWLLAIRLWSSYYTIACFVYFLVNSRQLLAASFKSPIFRSLCILLLCELCGDFFVSFVLKRNALLPQRSIKVSQGFPKEAQRFHKDFAKKHKGFTRISQSFNRTSKDSQVFKKGGFP